ncbi:MAG: class I SAM-dependent methyltransferase [Rhodospirillaceae bacterium]|nr:class I SAM-dependent methyltransferase [Rhodospirillaceae bacterium]
MTAPNFKGLTIPCPLCANNDLIRVGDRDRHGGTLTTDLCKRCGHVFTNPQPTEADLDRFYTKRYRSAYKGVLIPKSKHVYRAGLRALERLEQFSPFLKRGHRILDVGAGGGEFTYLMTKAGYMAQGIEPNRGYAEFAKTEYGINIQVGTVSDLETPDTPWDVITLHHVFEHLANPVAVLKGLVSHLSEDGVIVIEVPNVEARYHGPKRRFHFAHLHTFSKEGLTLAANIAGLSTQYTTLQPHTNHIHSFFRKSAAQAPDIDEAAAKRIQQHLQADTPMRDLVTSRPYRRLWANLNRPLREKRALMHLNALTGARDILDAMFNPVLEH